MSSLKDYMETMQIERVTHLIIKEFSSILGRKLMEDEIEYATKTTEAVIKKYSVVHDESIEVSNKEHSEKLQTLVESFVGSLSGLMVNFIMSRMEAYILYKRVKGIKDDDQS